MIRIENMSHELGSPAAAGGQFRIEDINLTLQDGEYLVLLGPTGAGKTVLVECVVGLHRPRVGRIVVDGRDLTALPPEQRQVGYVPQDYALFPNMTVERNVEYGLRVRGLPVPDRRERVDAMLERLGIAHLRHRLPLNLSGGERQRAALGRALITEPKVLLLDEPLSALDEGLRAELAAELRQLQRQENATFLHVCHSFEEAADVADRLVLMRSGRIEQVGTLQDILDRPANLFMARFTRTRNLFEGSRLDAATGRVALPGGIALRSTWEIPQGKFHVGIRPERVGLQPGPKTDGTNRLPARVVSLRLRPTCLEVTLQLDGGLQLVALDRLHAAVAPGDQVALTIEPESVQLLPAE